MLVSKLAESCKLSDKQNVQVIYKVKMQLDHTFFIVNCLLVMILEIHFGVFHFC